MDSFGGGVGLESVHGALVLVPRWCALKAQESDLKSRLWADVPRHNSL